MEKIYVLQMKEKPWSNKWVTLEGKYESAEAAEKERQTKIIPNEYRVAEAYTVIRYKPIKKALA